MEQLKKRINFMSTKNFENIDVAEWDKRRRGMLGRRL